MQRMILSLAGCLIAFGALTAWTQESGSKPSKPTAAKPAAEEEDKVSGRLPNNYGKLGLSDKQKKSIYETQGKYATEINELIRKVEELRGKRDAEVEGVLTAEQKVKLKELLAESAKKSAAKKAGKNGAEADSSK
ncbi:MAG TPA: hypothetical protein VFG20_20885 [Planctomycetaceae bacterium]|nr:hypothetical protein [Planctomycetaceae bacterium]